jgi:hypothetical protein
MTEWKHELNWPCSLKDAIYQVVFEPPENPAVVESMQDVESVTVLNEEWVDGVHISKMDIRMDPPIPRMLKSLLKNKPLGWIQDARWYPDKSEFVVNVIPHILPGLVKVHKLSIFTSRGEKQAHQDISLSATCDIPLVGTAFERFILGKLMDSINEKFAQMHS